MSKLITYTDDNGEEVKVNNGVVIFKENVNEDNETTTVITVDVSTGDIIDFITHLTKSLLEHTKHKKKAIALLTIIMDSLLHEDNE